MMLGPGFEPSRAATNIMCRAGVGFKIPSAKTPGGALAIRHPRMQAVSEASAAAEARRPAPVSRPPRTAGETNRSR